MTHTPFPRLIEERAEKLYEQYHNADEKDWNSANTYVHAEYRRAAFNEYAIEWAHQHPAAIAALVEGTACVLPVDPTDDMLDDIAEIPDSRSEIEREAAFTWRAKVAGIYLAMRAAGRLDKEKT